MLETTACIIFIITWAYIIYHAGNYIIELKKVARTERSINEHMLKLVREAETFTHITKDLDQ